MSHLEDVKESVHIACKHAHLHLHRNRREFSLYMWGLIVGSGLVDLDQYFEDLYVEGSDQDLPVTPEWAKDYSERVAKYFQE